MAQHHGCRRSEHVILSAVLLALRQYVLASFSSIVRFQTAILFNTTAASVVSCSRGQKSPFLFGVRGLGFFGVFWWLGLDHLMFRAWGMTNSQTFGRRVMYCALRLVCRGIRRQC